MKILGVIPARYASTRFPGKPLAEIGGKSMIQRVYEQAKKSPLLQQVIVATDDARILQHVRDFGGQVYMTSPEHQSGTDRCAEIAAMLPEYNYLINIQGDEPFISPTQIDLVCSCFRDESITLATLIKKITTQEELFNPSTPKVVVNNNSQAIYFSRTAIPFLRGKDETEWMDHHRYYKHIGIYGYRRDVLMEITELPVSHLEKAEALEQLRWVENGYSISVAETEIETQAIDTIEDLQLIIKNFNHLF